MIELYATGSPNVQKIEIMLEEIGLAYRVRRIDAHHGEHYSAEFTALNPNQKVPVIVDQDGPGGKPLTVFESGAILIYLAEKTGKFLPTEPIARVVTMQWLMIQLTGIGPMFGQFNHFIRYGQHDSYGVARYISQSRRLYDLIEERLSSNRYLAGDIYTIADIATFPWFRVESRMFGATHEVMDIDWKGHPHLTRWFYEIAERPAVKEALKAIDARKPFDAASPLEMDRYFARGEFHLPLGAEAGR